MATSSTIEKNSAALTSEAPAPDRWNHPALVVNLWLVAIVLHGIEGVVFSETFFSTTLFLASVPVFAAVVGATVTGLRSIWFSFAAKLLALDCIIIASQVGLQAMFGLSIWTIIWWLSITASLVVSGRITALAGIRAGVARATVGRAAIAVMIIVGTAPYTIYLDDQAYSLANSLPSGSDQPEIPTIDPEALWSAQPQLVKQSIDAVAPLRAAGQDAILVTVGASGSQDLFGREARTARTVLGQALGSTNRSILLANDKASLNRAPLATNTNLDAVLTGVARKLSGSNGLVVLYLTSHGSKDAELTTNLPDYSRLDAIGARRLAESLDRAGIRRRIVIVSACYAGSWIKPLASDDTIVIAAARADRTSFGCSDDRQLTYFGEALLTRKLAQGASLADSFDDARRAVTKWEREIDARHSEPQAFVGRNMVDRWKARNGPALDSPKPAA